VPSTPVSGLGRWTRGCSKRQNINGTFININVGFHPPHAQISSDASTISARSRIYPDSVLVHHRRLSAPPRERAWTDDLAGPYHPLNTSRNDSMSHLSVESSITGLGDTRETMTQMSEHGSVEPGGQGLKVPASRAEQIEHRRRVQPEARKVRHYIESSRPHAPSDANDRRGRRNDRIRDV